MKVFTRGVSGATTQLHLQTDATAGCLQALVHEHHGIPAASQRLVSRSAVRCSLRAACLGGVRNRRASPASHLTGPMRLRGRHRQVYGGRRVMGRGTLASFGIEDGATVEICLEVRGGGKNRQKGKARHYTTVDPALDPRRQMQQGPRDMCVFVQ